jgi:hypothetical protein
MHLVLLEYWELRLRWKGLISQRTDAHTKAASWTIWTHLWRWRVRTAVTAAHGAKPIRGGKSISGDLAPSTRCPSESSPPCTKNSSLMLSSCDSL